MLIQVPEGVAFRHELARLAVERLISPNRARVLHRKTVDALEAASTVDRPDLPRLAHHAEGAGDGKAVLRFAPRAAALAASVGAHREAAAQYARALRFSDDLSYEERADLLDRRSHECFLNDQYDEAIEAQQVALEYHRKLGDRRKEGTRSALSRRPSGVQDGPPKPSARAARPWPSWRRSGPGESSRWRSTIPRRSP